ncbi:MAG TPA: DUF1849 family protein [Candidatus Cybelea sp.]|nr:DUF1849 family protein [Candidatus Cybelea sp.]
MRHFSLLRFLPAAFLAPAFAVAATAARADDLVAHRASYILSLAPDSGAAEGAGGDGLMVFELKDACDGWATDLKLRFTMEGDNGESRTFDASQVAWEAKDGSAYRFTIKNGFGDQQDQLRGEAKVDVSTGKAEATSDLPTKSQAELPNGTLFPLNHTRLLLKKAAEGETVVSAEYFDGTASTQAMQASALIGAGEKDWPGLAKSFPALKGLTSYPIGLAFYLGDQTDATPDSEQFLRLYQNGVMGAFTFSLGNVKIHATLDQLELEPPPTC